MNRFTVKQALEKAEASGGSDDEEESSGRGISSRPKKRRGPKEESSSQNQRKLRVRLKTPVKGSVAPAEAIDESDADENDSAPEPSGERLQPVKSDTSDEESSEAEETSTPAHLQQRKWMRSPMQGVASDNEESDADAKDIPMHDVRKSLKFDNPSPERDAEDEPLDAEPPSDMRIGTKNHADEVAVEKDDDHDEAPADEPTQYGYMKRSEVQALMQTLEDPWVQQKEFLFEQHQKKFAEWHLSLRMGLNILVYGVGSKRSLLEAFRERTLSLEVTVVIEGFQPDCNLRATFAALHEQFIEGSAPRSMVEVTDNLEKFIGENYDHFNLIIHSIDGPALRNSASQRLLARFSRMKNVHLVATMDHPNLPQLWSDQEVNDFRWVYHNTPTFVDYQEYPLPDLTRSGPQNKTLILVSLQHVFDSLTSNAKLIYQEIAKFQIKASDPAEDAVTGATGMPYKDLYRACRSAFLVSTEPVLRKQLTEFYDHNLLRSQRGSDGVEYLRIPIAETALKEFLAGLSA